MKGEKVHAILERDSSPRPFETGGRKEALIQTVINDIGPHVAKPRGEVLYVSTTLKNAASIVSDENDHRKESVKNHTRGEPWTFDRPKP
jgi:hypothetical protein